MEVKFKFNDSKFMREVYKELMPRAIKITAGVKDGTHFKAVGKRKNGHTKGGFIGYIDMGYLAAIHEYGLGKNPRRSFLRDTINRFLEGDFIDISYEYKRIDFMMKALANKIYERIQQAFDTNGFGAWERLSLKYKQDTGRTDPALTDTGQLRGAIYTEYAGMTLSGKTITGGHSSKPEGYGLFKTKREANRSRK